MYLAEHLYSWFRNRPYIARYWRQRNLIGASSLWAKLGRFCHWELPVSRAFAHWSQFLSKQCWSRMWFAADFCWSNNLGNWNKKKPNTESTKRFSLCPTRHRADSQLFSVSRHRILSTRWGCEGHRFNRFIESNCQSSLEMNPFFTQEWPSQMSIFSKKQYKIVGFILINTSYKITKPSKIGRKKQRCDNAPNDQGVSLRKLWQEANFKLSSLGQQ